MKHSHQSQSAEGKRLMLIAFHFPPVQGSTGVTRSLAFAKYLRDCGWEVAVLTASPKAYPEIRNENLKNIPSYIRVERGFARDTQRHFSIFGKYALFMATPDRWQSWILGGCLKARRLIREWHPTAIMSTYPIASAHQLGYLVSKWSGLPWIADFRDPMAQDNYPTDPTLHRSYTTIEKRVFRHASQIVVTTEGTADFYRSRYPAFDPDRIIIIPNGFDEAMFPKDRPARSGADPERKTVLLHSGVIYPKERNPTEFFHAIHELRNKGMLDSRRVEFRLRATGHDALYAPQLEKLGITDLVKLLPAVPYEEALTEMLMVDACMILQAASCNDQIPAKLYEYLYADQPILGLTDPKGDTGQLMQAFGMTDIASLHDRPAMVETIPAFLNRLETGVAARPDHSAVLRFSRRSLTGALAQVLDKAISHGQPKKR